MCTITSEKSILDDITTELF